MPMRWTERVPAAQSGFFSEWAVIISHQAALPARRCQTLAVGSQSIVLEVSLYFESQHGQGVDKC